LTKATILAQLKRKRLFEIKENDNRIAREFFKENNAARQTAIVLRDFSFFFGQISMAFLSTSGKHTFSSRRQIVDCAPNLCARSFDRAVYFVFFG